MPGVPGDDVLGEAVPGEAVPGEVVPIGVAPVGGHGEVMDAFGLVVVVVLAVGDPPLVEDPVLVVDVPPTWLVPVPT